MRTLPASEQFHQHDDIGVAAAQRGMDRVVVALPGIDAASGRDFRPAHIEGPAGMAAPFRSPLPGAAGPAALHQQPFLVRRRPERLGKFVRNRARHSFRQVAHSAASAPNTELLTGVTIGPEPTTEISAPSTWLGERPRIWRTASIFNSSPCM